MRPNGLVQRSKVERSKSGRIWPALAILVAAVAAVPATSADAAERLATSTATTVQTTYQNPVSKTFADTYADPSVLRAADGWWWAYGTTDPLREGESTRHVIPISKSRNLVDCSMRYYSCHVEHGPGRPPARPADCPSGDANDSAEVRT